MSKINKNLKEIDIYTLSLLLCSLFSCNNGDNNYNNSAINNEKLLGVPEGKIPDLNNNDNNSTKNKNIEEPIQKPYVICCETNLREFIKKDFMKYPIFNYILMRNNQGKEINIKINGIKYVISNDNISPVYSNKVNNIYEIEIEGISGNMINLANMFKNIKSKKITVKIASIVKITDMSYMFENCSNIESIIIECDTSNVTNMEGMFKGCSNLKTITFWVVVH